MASCCNMLLLPSATTSNSVSPVCCIPRLATANSVGFVSFAANGVLKQSVGGRKKAWSLSVRAQTSSATESSKELERFAAKGDLLLSIKDAGGLKGLSDRKADSHLRIEVNEKILALERLNATLRPTTSPYLEGLWEFQFAGARSPGLAAAKFLLKRFPSSLASLTSLTLLILDGPNAKAIGKFKVFNAIENTFTLTTKLSVEGPIRLKEEYVEGLFASPTVPEGNVPSQLRGLIDQFAATVERLPNAVKDVVSGGVKVPLANTFSRELIISYLDQEVMIVRDKSGIADVLVRIEAPATDTFTAVNVIPEYSS